MTLAEIATFCMKYAGYRASGTTLDRKEMVGTLTSYNNNIIYLAKDAAPWFIERENDPNLKIPFVVSGGDYFVVKKARSGNGCFPTSVIIISHAKEEVEKLIKALEL